MDWGTQANAPGSSTDLTTRRNADGDPCHRSEPIDEGNVPASEPPRTLPVPSQNPDRTRTRLTGEQPYSHPESVQSGKSVDKLSPSSFTAIALSASEVPQLTKR